jgi:hypothetical protein
MLAGATGTSLEAAIAIPLKRGNLNDPSASGNGIMCRGWPGWALSGMGGFGRKQTVRFSDGAGQSAPSAGN